MKPLLILTIIAFAVMSTMAQTQTKTARPSTLTGRILDEDGQPLAGASVSALRAGGVALQGATTTDAQGRFTISNLSPSAYSILANFAPYVSPVNATTMFYRPGEMVSITLVKGGVITGKIVDAQGEPIPGMMVSAGQVRDGEGQSLAGRGGASRFGMADDRGVYRLYGLPAGAYHVVARNNGNYFIGNPDPEIQIYYPSTTMDGAEEVRVTPGAEVSGIDINVRHQRGHFVSGTVTGAIASPSNAGIPVRLLSAATGQTVANIFVQARSGSTRFALPSVPDGEYELIANRTAFDRSAGDTSAYSEPRKITVKGSDVTGIELRLLPMATIAGRVVLEPLPSGNKTCSSERAITPEEIVIQPMAIEMKRLLNRRPTTPDASGNFELPDFPAGRFQLTTELPHDSWYRKSITREAKNWHNGFDIGVSEQLKGVTITFAEGAASVQGRVIGKASAVYLIPAERDEVERYFVTTTRSDATFSFRAVAPGNYWLIARAEGDAEQFLQAAEQRAKLRREAEAANQSITLKSCQRVQNYALKVVP